MVLDGDDRTEISPRAALEAVLTHDERAGARDWDVAEAARAEDPVSSRIASGSQPPRSCPGIPSGWGIPHPDVRRDPRTPSGWGPIRH